MQLMVICSWCGKFMRFKDAGTQVIPKVPITHSICPVCKIKVDEEINNIEGGNYERECKTGSEQYIRQV